MNSWRRHFMYGPFWVGGVMIWITYTISHPMETWVWILSAFLTGAVGALLDTIFGFRV